MDEDEAELSDSCQLRLCDCNSIQCWVLSAGHDIPTEDPCRHPAIATRPIDFELKSVEVGQEPWAILELWKILDFGLIDHEMYTDLERMTALSVRR